MNEVPKLGSGNYPANVRFWVVSSKNRRFDQIIVTATTMLRHAKDGAFPLMSEMIS